MEGQRIVSSDLTFIESKRKFQASPGPVDYRSYKLITTAHNHGLILLGCSIERTVKAIQTIQLLPEHSQSNQSYFTLQLTFRPTILSVAQNGFSSVLMVAGFDDSKNCPCTEFFDIDDRKSIGKLDLQELTGTEIFDYAWHPRYFDSILALCSKKGDLLVIAVKRKEKSIALVYKEYQYGVLTCCWSPKGKNLAVATLKGEILRLEPSITSTSFSFKEVENSRMILSNTRISADHKIIKLRWMKVKLLICVHTRLNDQVNPDTIYSLITLKQNDPHFYWSNLCSELAHPNFNIQLINLSNAIICMPSSSGEAAILSVANEAKANEPGDWSSFIIDEEGARIELPLDSNNQETYSRGVTVAYMKKEAAIDHPENVGSDGAERPIIVFYTTSGCLVSYTAVHNRNILKLPGLQPPLECPMNIPKRVEPLPPAPALSFDLNLSNSLNLSSSLNLGSSMNMSNALNMSNSFNLSKQKPLTFASLASAPFPTSTPAPAPTITPVPAVIKEVIQPREVVGQLSQKELNLKEATLRAMNFGKELSKDIVNVKKKIEFNEMFLTLLDDINYIRGQLDEVQDIHKIHRDALEAIKLDIDALDLGMLENLYLIEYIKSRSKGSAIKKSIDPMTSKKVEAIRQKLKVIAEKLRDLDVYVEVAWEDFVRRKNALGNNKKRSLNSLDIIYKTLSTNQKILNVLKKKASLHTPAPESPEPHTENVLVRRELDPLKMRAFREFLASRNVVPVRRPESVRHSLRSNDTTTLSNK